MTYVQGTTLSEEFKTSSAQSPGSTVDLRVAL